MSLLTIGAPTYKPLRSWCVTTQYGSTLEKSLLLLAYEGSYSLAVSPSRSSHRTKHSATTVRFTGFIGWPVGLEPTNGGTTIRCLNQLGDGHHMHGSRNSRAYPQDFVPTFVLLEFLFAKPITAFCSTACYQVPEVGLEPTTSYLWGRRSHQLSYSGINGGEGRIRTSNAHRALVLQTNVFTF